MTTPDKHYDALKAHGTNVLYDHRTRARAGEKFAAAYIIGLPYSVIISARSLANGQFEVKKRDSTEAHLLEKDKVIKMVARNEVG